MLVHDFVIYYNSIIDIDNLGYVDDQVTLTTIQFSCDRFGFDVIQYNISAIWYTAKDNEQWRKYLYVLKWPILIFVGLWSQVRVTYDAAGGIFFYQRGHSANGIGHWTLGRVQTNSARHKSLFSSLFSGRAPVFYF
jgi:hypothetical protein